MPSIKRSSSSQTQTNDSLNDLPPIKRLRKTTSDIDKWDGITSIFEMRKEARAVDALCKNYASQRDQDRAFIAFLQKQVLARDKIIVNQLLPQQLATLLKEDLIASIELQMRDPRVGNIQFQQYLTEEAFGQIVEEAEKIQGTPLRSIYQFQLDVPAVNRWLGRSVCEGLSLKIEYDETTKVFRALGQYPRRQ